MVQQISVYTENKKGAMRKLLAALSAEGINVLGFVNNDSAEFGTVRLILSDTAMAMQTLEKEGYLCRRSSVLGVELPDTPGSLEAVLEILEQMNINVDYMYVGYRRENAMPIILIHCESMDIVSDALAKRGYSVY